MFYQYVKIIKTNKHSQTIIAMLYSNILSKIDKCDEISLEYQDANRRLVTVLSESPLFQSFLKDKANLKNELYDLYNKKYRGPLSLRVIYDRSISLNVLQSDNDYYGLTKSDIDNIYYKIDEFNSKNSCLYSKLDKFAETLDFVQFFLKKYNFCDDLIGCHISGLDKIGTANYKLRIIISLNERSLKIFSNEIKNDLLTAFISSGMNPIEIEAMKFEDPIISYKGNIVFSSISHEGYYFFKSKK